MKRPVGAEDVVVWLALAGIVAVALVVTLAMAAAPLVLAGWVLGIGS